ncbi:hypothetical protein GQ53DRAFT_833866 [Thozetella sp. PMI_491]|nr:hypothetical protein GQ53DRAFT_833866 [Thozetella sp. PMI_491]
MELETFDPSGDTCQAGTMDPGNDPAWSLTPIGDLKAFVTGDGLDKNCKIGIFNQDPNFPGHCGVTATVINGAESHACRGITVTKNLGIYYCCSDEQCQADGILKMRDEPRQLAASNSHLLATRHGNSSSKLARTREGNGPLGRDVTSVKRAPILQRRDDCKWNPSGGLVKKRSSVPQKLSVNSPCSNTEGCHLEHDVTVSWEATSTFEISSTVGASFFDLVEASITLGYR